MEKGTSQSYRSEAFVVQAMDQWGSTVFRLAFAQTACWADAEDIHQEVFIRLFKDSTQFKDVEHTKAWLLRVTINCCRDLARSSWQRRVTRVEEFESFVNDIDTLSIEAMVDLAQALERLPEDMRAVIHLYYYEGYSSEEIAECLDVNASTVRTRLERARKKLRTLLGGMGNDREHLQRKDG